MYCIYNIRILNQPAAFQGIGIYRVKLKLETNLSQVIFDFFFRFISSIKSMRSMCSDD